MKVLSEPNARIDPAHYQFLMRRHLPTLVSTGGMKTFDFLCRLLAKAVRTSRSDHKRYSQVWRQAIEDRSERHAQSITDTLISALVDAGEQILTGDVSLLPKIIRMLERRRSAVFVRLALYFLWRFGENQPDIIAKYLKTERFFRDSELRREYRMLLRLRFASLKHRDRQTILRWIEKGIERRRLIRNIESWGATATDDVVNEALERWRLEQLEQVAEALSDRWRRRYDDLRRRFGAMPPSDLELHSGATYVGPTSPIAQAQIAEMSVDDLVSYLKNRRPPTGAMVPSPEGLGRTISEAVKSAPDRYSSQIAKFVGVEPTYARALLDGFAESLRTEQIIDWAAVLSFCEWALTQMTTARPEEGQVNLDRDPDWSWTRKAIAHLISNGLVAESNGISYELKSRVFALLERLTTDSDPTPEYEQRYGGANMDPAAMSINTTRGEALQAVIKYALWIRRQGPADSWAGFSTMPEVTTVLERHLDVRLEPSLAIRAVYGRWFPWLVLLDRAWVAAHVQQIFPTDAALRPYHDSAWETYIVFCEPYTDSFALLQDEYKRAVQSIGRRESPWRYMADPDDRLSQHLMALYWRGDISFESTDRLLPIFYDVAPPKLRGHALRFIGQSLKNTPGSIAGEIVDRLRSLWNQRKDAGLRSGPTGELATFGWWLISEKFEALWSLQEAQNVLEIEGRIDPDLLIVDYLPKLAQSIPAAVVAFLRLMIDSATAPLQIQMWQEDIRKIIAAVSATNDQAALIKAREIVNVLAARGFVNEFRDLIARG
jgi:hypothetical protein